MTRTVPALILLAALALAPSPNGAAAAQCRLCDTPTNGGSDEPAAGPIALEIEASLDFDRLVLLGNGEAIAELLPDGSRQVSGMAGTLSSRAMVGSARITGEPGRFVRIDLPRRIELFSLSGGAVAIDSLTSDLPGSPRLDSRGQLTFRFGGRLKVSGDAEGDYRGDIPITVEYL